MIKKAIDLINTSKTIAIFSHINPDGDTYGSGLALYSFLIKAGKDVFLFCDGVPNFKFESLKGIQIYNLRHLDEYDLAITVDCSDEARLGKYLLEFYNCKKSIAFDHHSVYEEFTDLAIRKVDSSSNSEIMLNFMESYDKKLIDKDIAEYLYMGMITDNGVFAYDSVNEETFDNACRLMKYGVKNYEISYKYFYKNSKEIFNLTNNVLSKTRFFDNDRIGVISFFEEDFVNSGTDNKNTQGIINNVLNIDSILVAISIIEVAKNSFRVSIRTKDSVDATKIALAFGGGGHKRAAGCRLSGFYEDVVDKLVRVSSLEI